MAHLPENYEIITLFIHVETEESRFPEAPRKAELVKSGFSEPHNYVIRKLASRNRN